MSGCPDKIEGKQRKCRCFILATALFNMKEFEYAKEVCECVAEVFPGCEAVGEVSSKS